MAYWLALATMAVTSSLWRSSGATGPTRTDRAARYFWRSEWKGFACWLYWTGHWGTKAKATDYIGWVIEDQKTQAADYIGWVIEDQKTQAADYIGWVIEDQKTQAADYIGRVIEDQKTQAADYIGRVIEEVSE